MRAVIQRVSKASVTINGKIHAKINDGLLVLLGIEDADTKEDGEWLSGKIVNLRIFNDENGVMNVSIKEIDGEILLISQFTLHASTKKGNRPSYIKAAKPEIAVPLYQKFIDQMEKELVQITFRWIANCVERDSDQCRQVVNHSLRMRKT